ncbi:Aste57867_12783 [Aphanomyces stellatus]|uniref:non-specific serine/threonine protein kinase n=1 Tax=Aphanomyces stellatus TaxID=120398 RepID=A0A485KWH1_9STRA|nr:hypothetical protein As57867_012735 [Aphanomyces stellatus]VFT89632.1 Aste57867_12783 [Aphanomyces stellatus]
MLRWPLHCLPSKCPPHVMDIVSFGNVQCFDESKENHEEIYLRVLGIADYLYTGTKNRRHSGQGPMSAHAAVSSLAVCNAVGSLTDYEAIRQLGSGIYGDVYLCNRKRDNEIVCVKHVDLASLSAAQTTACWNEVRVCERLHHPNIVTYYSAFVDTGVSVLAIEMEFCDGGDLSEWLYAHHQDIDEAAVVSLFVQICLGVHHMHRCCVLHRDLKPKNIFVFDNGRAVVGDFGISKCLETSSGLAQTLVGSPSYMCPEVFEGKPYGFKADIWSLGCILYELLTGRCPFRASSYPALVQKITSCDYDPLSPAIRLPLRHLVATMLSLRAEDRPTVDTVLALPSLEPFVEAHVASGHKYFQEPMQPSMRLILQEQFTALVETIDGRVTKVSSKDQSQLPPKDIKSFVKSKKLATVLDSSLDSKAIVQLRALQNAKRYNNQRVGVSKSNRKTAMDLPLCQIHLTQFDERCATPLASLLPPPPHTSARGLQKQRSSKVIVATDDPKPNSPRRTLHPKKLRGVSPPPPPTVGIRPPKPVVSSSLVLGVNPLAVGGASAMQVVGHQIKSVTKHQQQT